MVNLEVSGAPGSTGDQGTCGNMGCHTSGAFNPSLTLEVTDRITQEVVTQYVPGRDYLVKLIFAADMDAAAFGFQAVVLDDNDANIGAWEEVSLPSAIQITALGDRSYLEHTQPNSASEWGAFWTAPEAGAGNMTVYAAGIASNSNGSPAGDGVTSASLTISEEDPNAVAQIDQDFADITIVPSPITDWANVRISSQVAGDVQLNVLSITGQNVFAEKINLQQGENNERLNLSHLQSGLYFLQLIGDDRMSTRQMIKL